MNTFEKEVEKDAQGKKESLNKREPMQRAACRNEPACCTDQAGADREIPGIHYPRSGSDAGTDKHDRDSSKSDGAADEPKELETQQKITERSRSFPGISCSGFLKENEYERSFYEKIKSMLDVSRSVKFYGWIFSRRC